MVHNGIAVHRLSILGQYWPDTFCHNSAFTKLEFFVINWPCAGPLLDMVLAQCWKCYRGPMLARYIGPIPIWFWSNAGNATKVQCWQGTLGQFRNGSGPMLEMLQRLNAGELHWASSETNHLAQCW